MAEGIVSGALGGETAAEQDAALASADSFAAAIAMVEAEKSPEVAAQAAAFLRKQGALTDLQVKHFDQERRLAIQGAKLKRAMDWLKLAMQGAITLVLFGVAGGLIAMVWSAAHDHGLVIESFTVPPDIAAQQIKGEQLAALVADKIATIDAHAQSFRAEQTFQIDWGNDVKIEVPGAGISFGELDRLLREKLGHQTRIGGTLYHSGNALRLSLHTGEGEAVEVAGDAAHLDELTQKAAEAVVGTIQPFKYSKYLEFANRTDEAMSVARKAATAGSAGERAWAWAQISNLLSKKDLPAAYEAGLQAIALDPGIALGYLNAGGYAGLMGHDTISNDLFKRSVELAHNGGGGLSEIGRFTGGQMNAADVSAATGDYGQAISILMQSTGPLYPGVVERYGLANFYTLSHDIQAADRSKTGLSDTQLISQLYIYGSYVAPQYDRAVEGQNWSAAITAAQLSIDALAKDPEGPELAKYAMTRFVLPNMAYALAQSGQLAEAQKIAATLPEDCYLCQRTKAWVAGISGDMILATREYSDAIRQNPRLPFADYEWGKLLLLKNDLAGAASHIERATQAGPRFADPLKYWGDALARQRKWRDAVEKYAAAAQHTPKWGALHMMWGRALWIAGRHEEARAQFGAAAGLNLSVDDRAWLGRMKAVAAKYR